MKILTDLSEYLLFELFHDIFAQQKYTFFLNKRLTEENVSLEITGCVLNPRPRVFSVMVCIQDPNYFIS